MNIPTVILGLLFTLVRAEDLAEKGAIGIEDGSEIVLSRGDYIPRPFDDRTPLIVRLGDVREVPHGFSYRLHFLGFEPGEYRLADFLMLPDGSDATELGDRTFRVATILPEDHDGSLTAHLPSPLPWFGGYRVLLIGLAAVWVAGWLALAWFGRRRKKEEVVETVEPAPSFAERLRPYVTSAVEGSLDTGGQAELERLLLGYWRDKLEAPSKRMADDLAQLREHPEAGKLIGAVERWMHQPGGTMDSEIEGLLAPYQSVHKKEVSA